MGLFFIYSTNTERGRIVAIERVGESSHYRSNWYFEIDTIGM